MDENDINRFVIAQEQLPEKFPTHRHQSEFWESLGRAVGTFGFLEAVLGKAIFALSGTRPYEEDEIKSGFGDALYIYRFEIMILLRVRAKSLLCY